MEIRQKVLAIISERLQVPVAELTPESHFRSLPAVDSMRILQIILETEKEFGIEIGDDVTFRIETVGQFQDVVEELCGQGAAR